MDELRKLVQKLADVKETGIAGRNKRVLILQKLNEKLLSEYYIKKP